MSKALDYLLAARPEAMNNYFSFLKHSGKHLDPKTKAIISVITKVDNQTEAGFRQYLRRAIREGVTADEILDSLLVAFPTLGLTKIIWAIDILLEMDMDEFGLDRIAPVKSWHDIGHISEFENRTISGLSCEGKTLFVSADGGNSRVYDSICPHQATDIPIDAVNGTLLTCPRHNWVFDLQTGECVARGDKPLNVIESKIENERLYAYW